MAQNGQSSLPLVLGLDAGDISRKLEEIDAGRNAYHEKGKWKRHHEQK